MKVYNSLANPEYETTPLTDFSSVDSRTTLGSLNLNWRERDLPERDRTKHVHRLHPYLGKYIPQLVEIFIRKFHPTSVYDPFCGCGTTLVEANALGIGSVGLIDYHEQHRYAYELLNLPRRDDLEIGAAYKGKSANAHQNYLAGIKDVFSNAQKYMKKNGVAVIVIGDRENLYTDEMAEELGFTPVERLRRHVNRRTGRRNSDFFEDVLIWKNN